MQENKLLSNAEIKQLLELLARSKAVWMDPDLLTLAESAENPSHAYRLIIEKIGKRKKALAARWYAVAKRDFHPDLVSACAKWLKYTGNQNIEALGKFLYNALGSEEHELKWEDFKMTEKIRILVVDDKEENRKAASEFFSSQNMEVDFATSLEEADEKLDNHVELYHGAIIDLELPVPGGIVEKVGFFLAKKAQNYGLPSVVLTAGDHHGPISRIFDEDEIPFEIGPAKNTPAAYKLAFEVLLKLCPMESMIEIFESRKRYKERVKKQYQTRPTK
ncbi:MAG: response regulator [Candidatus Pacebacteria bacterium]|nr:response regulator [Candidatus Paceibacterota bacterium]